MGFGAAGPNQASSTTVAVRSKTERRDKHFTGSVLHRCVYVYKFKQMSVCICTYAHAYVFVYVKLDTQ